MTSADTIAIIRKNKHNPIRRAYIKRRLYDATYEADWQRIDSINGRERVIDWGSISIEIDNQPGEIAKFEVSGLRMVMDNSEGYFDIESSENSLWFPEYTYLNRKFTKIRIDCGYYDGNGEEIGVETIFEGFINKVSISEDYKANIEILSYQSILARYPIKDLALSGEKSVSTIINTIMNQSKITEYIPYVASVPVNDVSITLTEDLQGTYWDVIQDLAFKSASVPLLNITSFSFVARTMGGSSVYDFKGEGADNDPDIFKVNNYDDEGADRVRVYFTEKDGVLSSISNNALLLKKYLAEPEDVDVSKISTGDKQSVLDELVGIWETPKPSIEFSTRFLLNTINPLDQITIEILGPIDNRSNVCVMNINNFDDDSVFAKSWGGIFILAGTKWMVSRIVKDIADWSCTIKAERQA